MVLNESFDIAWRDQGSVIIPFPDDIDMAHQIHLRIRRKSKT
jgi:hypothetical protein